MPDFDIYRNETVAREELTNQAEALTLLRPQLKILNAHLVGETTKLDDCDIMAAVMWLFDNMIYYESRIDCPGIARKEPEGILIKA
jgi:hypothetical protein